MFAQIAYPDNLLGEELDEYLARGWFRMRQSIFTTNFIHFNQQFYSAIWLRVDLTNFIPDKRFLSLRKLNKDFRTEINKSVVGSITAQHETLYQYYRQNISFDISPSLPELLLGIETFNRYNTWMVNIYDENTLVASGFFDVGKNSAAGISSIYHPAYKKHSLGKYMVYLKMNFCKQQQLQYFYPGYVVPGYAAFDYKLEIGKGALQYLQLSTQHWQPYNPLSTMQIPLQGMVERLSILQVQLAKYNLQNAVLFYRFFEANLDPYFFGHELFDFPVFLYCFPIVDTSPFFLVVYDIRDTKYHLLQCRSVINISSQENFQTIFDSGLLKVEQEIFSTEISEEMSFYLHELLKS